MTRKMLTWVQRFLRWLFGAPFQGLPSEFGDPVPPELRVFEATAEEAQHRAQGSVLPPAVPPEHTRPARRDESLDRE
jgi:hypothetical protein